jgi:hypothetical protein
VELVDEFQDKTKYRWRNSGRDKGRLIDTRRRLLPAVEVGAANCLCGPETLVVSCTNIVHCRQSPYSRNEICRYIIGIIIYKKQQQKECQIEFTTKTSKRRRKKKRKKEVREKHTHISIYSITLNKFRFYKNHDCIH